MLLVIPGVCRAAVVSIRLALLLFAYCPLRLSLGYVSSCGTAGSQGCHVLTQAGMCSDYALPGNCCSGH